MWTKRTAVATWLHELGSRKTPTRKKRLSDSALDGSGVVRAGERCERISGAHYEGQQVKESDADDSTFCKDNNNSPQSTRPSLLLLSIPSLFTAATAARFQDML